MSDDTTHSLRSSHREALLEHLFAGEVMKHLWLRGDWRLEALKPQVDDSGYDLVLEANGVVRHIQLKASFRGSTVRDVKVNTLLAAKPSGCVVFMWFDRDTLALGPFGFFGGGPGQRLPDISGMRVGRHTKANAKGVKAKRQAIRVVPLSRFEKRVSIDAVVASLFGLQGSPSSEEGT
jgi:hypothetical protein